MNLGRVYKPLELFASSQPGLLLNHHNTIISAGWDISSWLLLLASRVPQLVNLTK